MIWGGTLLHYKTEKENRCHPKHGSKLASSDRLRRPTIWEGRIQFNYACPMGRVPLLDIYHEAVFHLALSNMAQRLVAFCEHHVALHERYVALPECHVALHMRHIALLKYGQ